MTSPAPCAEWAVVYEASAERLIHLATMLVGPHDAQDLVSDAVLRAVTSPGWRNVTSRSAYLTRTLINLAHDRRGQSSRRDRREQRVSRLRAAGDDGSGAMADVDRRLVVRGALASLSAGQLAVVYLHYWEDLTLAQTAEHLNLAEGTVRRQLDRAKRKLRDSLRIEEGPLA